MKKSFEVAFLSEPVDSAPAATHRLSPAAAQFDQGNAAVKFPSAPEKNNKRPIKSLQMCFSQS